MELFHWWLLFMAVMGALSPILCYLDALLGGWRALAAKYPALAKKRSDGRRLDWQEVYLENGGTGCTAAIVTVYKDGMQIDMPIPLLRLFYPSMFLPWHDIVSVVKSRRLFVDKVRLTFAKSTDDPVTINESLAYKIFKFAGPVWGESGTHRFGTEVAVASKPTEY